MYKWYPFFDINQEVFGIGATTLDTCCEGGGSATFKMHNYILDSHFSSKHQELFLDPSI